MTRPILLLTAIVLGVGACRAATPEVADATNAVAAYVHVSQDVDENNDVIDRIVRASDNEPSEAAGLIRGLRAIGRQEAANGVWGWEFIFQSDVTQAQRLNFASRAQALKLEVIWLNGDDEWPWCVGEDRCLRVQDSGDFP